jgi:hypothetical protein
MNVTTVDVTTSVTTAETRLASTHPLPRQLHSMRRRRYLANAAALALAAVLVVWTLAPIYNMVMIALTQAATCSATIYGRRTRRSKVSGSC